MQTPIKWMHQVKPEWLEARREHQILTASEIKKLLPAWTEVMGFVNSKKRGCIMQGRKKTDEPITVDDVKNANPLDFSENKGVYEPFIKVYAEKRAEAEIDVNSYGSAARGHIFEPYAVKNFNSDFEEQFYHWDDALIRNKDKLIGFSPDAIDFEQPKNCPVAIEAGNGEGDQYRILEIKCYEPGHHMNCLLTDPENLEERWQIAAAFYTDNCIKSAYLYFWCPMLDSYGRGIHYTRTELELEIAIVKSMCEIYCTVWHELSSRKFTSGGNKPMFTIDDITKDYLEEISKPENVLERMVV